MRAFGWSFAIVMLCACSGKGHTADIPPPEPPPRPEVTPELPVVRTLADAKAHDGQEIRLVGHYKLIDVRMRARPPAVYKGHAAVKLEGGSVFLEAMWAPEAIRPEAEQALQKELVEAVGVMHAVCPEPPEPRASMATACLRPVTSVAKYSE